MLTFLTRIHLNHLHPVRFHQISEISFIVKITSTRSENFLEWKGRSFTPLKYQIDLNKHSLFWHPSVHLLNVNILQYQAYNQYIQTFHNQSLRGSWKIKYWSSINQSLIQPMENDQIEIISKIFNIEWEKNSQILFVDHYQYIKNE